MRLLIFVSYLIAVLLNLWASYTQNHFIESATKPILMSFLSVYFWQQTKPRLFAFEWWILFGLICSMCGDIWFMRNDDNAFLYGLFSFLLMHACYLVGFLVYKSPTGGILRGHPFIILPFLIIWSCINYFLRHGVQSMQIPVGIYSAFITAMVVGAINLRSKIGTVGSFLLGGALLFAVSDIFIALHKFNPDINIWHPSFIIMFAYIAGQWIISLSSIQISQDLSKIPKSVSAVWLNQ
ncbi:lysoplasmalogenase [Deinococcus ruber]|uniref:lysoplasmalogenase n=1 Tax=Deinococcus ruber TaxID=1848197 RepID=UPI00166297E3|nr:lysoplasmalogenase [Deinococcus ruber]